MNLLLCLQREMEAGTLRSESVLAREKLADRLQAHCVTTAAFATQDCIVASWDETNESSVSRVNMITPQTTRETASGSSQPSRNRVLTEVQEPSLKLLLKTLGPRTPSRVFLIN